VLLFLIGYFLKRGLNNENSLNLSFPFNFW
jgi:hypothetical protein